MMIKVFHTFTHYERKNNVFESNYVKYCLPVFKIHKDSEFFLCHSLEKSKTVYILVLIGHPCVFSPWFLSFPSPRFRTPRCPDLSFNKYKTKYFVFSNK